MNHSIRVEENSACRYRRITGGGIRVIWELTGRCNLKCRHCFASVYPEARKVSTELTTEEALAIIRQFNDLPVAKVMLTGGEVFVRNDIISIIQTIRETGKQLVIDITTNALLVTESMIDELLMNNVDELSISLDGTEEVYHKVRGANTDFNRLLKNIRMLVRKGISVDGIMVLNKLTYEGIDKTVELAASLGLSSFTIANLEVLPHSNFDYESLKLSNSDLALCLQCIELLKKRYRDKLIIRTTGFINCCGLSACPNDEIIAIDRDGMYCHCLNVYNPNDLRLDSRMVALKDAMKIINTTMHKDR